LRHATTVAASQVNGRHLILVMRVHLPAADDGLMDPVPALYAIRVKGQLGATALSAFPAMVPWPDGADTVLTGLLDQSALFGVLAEVEALGLDLLEVRQLTRPWKAPGSGERRSLWPD
jgi:hypothetical protein